MSENVLVGNFEQHSEITECGCTSNTLLQFFSLCNADRVVPRHMCLSRTLRRDATWDEILLSRIKKKLLKEC